MPHNLLQRLCLYQKNGLCAWRHEQATFLLCKISADSKSSFPTGTGGESTQKQRSAAQNERMKWRLNRRASLSPAQRVFDALSKESGEADQHMVETDFDDGSTFHTRHGKDAPLGDQPKSETDTIGKESPGHESLSDGKRPHTESVHEHLLKGGRRHLSPLKRYSAMMPEGYVREADSSAKKNLDEVLKADDKKYPPK
ncbi:hypothetical protein BaRGS_00015370 [Batillaria attramentaria]|uniref:Uncharacterized protein n=1 Tax=Batillaria attramentaria TaxID=370345 RepID=A0ABD0L2C7_9CAEN